MDEIVSVDKEKTIAVPPPLQALFNDHEHVRVQKLPCAIPGLDSKVVFFEAGARTMPHQHAEGQHMIVTSGTGVVGDENGVRVVTVGDVITNPPGGWHWHGATPTTSMAHLTIENPGLDLDVDKGDWESSYTEELGS